MAESIRSKANRYRRGDFTKGELLTIIGAFVADQVVDVATYGQLSKLKGKALAKVVFPAGKAAGSIIARGGMGAASVAGRSLIGAAAPVVANPYVAGTALGLGALASPQGQALLEAAEQRGRMDRIRLEQGLTDLRIAGGEFGRDLAEINFPSQKVARRKTKSAYNTAVSKGMKALKKSTSYGKKGVLNSPKKAFAFVAKTVSKLRKGKKVSSKGASGVVKRSTSKVPGIKSIKVRK